MKQIYRESYVVYGLLEGKILDSKEITTLDEIKTYLKNLGFSLRGRLKFANETRKQDVEYVNDEPIFTDTLIGIHEAEEFYRGSTMLTVMKFKYYSPFSGLLKDDEYLYYINDIDIQAGKNATYLISDYDNIFKLNTKDNTVIKMRIDENRNRLKIKGIKYKIDYLKTKKGDKYKF